ncbi:MAG TPA: copper amine oxidase N-terminal domain-containing protein, partial [Desulfotomaculum sp.]|nr:copper amine oxidase N-terminal domain-containing protein [Desulfotomaculum sp.]
MRKLMRKPIILLAGLLLALLAFALPALAAPAHQAGQNRYRQAVFFVGHNEYFIKAERPKDMDTDPTVEGFVNEEGFRPIDAAPFVENGRTYVPVRYLALALGIRPEDIGWNANTGTVSMITQKEIRWFGFGPFLFPEGKLPEPLTVSDIMKALEGYDWSANLTEEDIIDWKYDDEKHQSVSGHCRIPPVIRLKLIIGNKTLLVNGQTKTMDVAPLIREGRTYLPARWVAEAFGYEVKWDEARRAVLVGNPPPPAPELPKRNLSPDGPIDLTAAKNGTLGVPENAVAPPSKWGFEPKIKRLEFEIGNRYATATRFDGGTFQVDLGMEPVYVSDSDNVASFIPKDKLIVIPYNDRLFALYVPFIPVAEAFGVPRGNIVWDGEHLGVWGFYGHVED